MLFLPADHAIPNEAAFTRPLLLRTTLRRRGSRHRGVCQRTPRQVRIPKAGAPQGVDASLRPSSKSRIGSRRCVSCRGATSGTPECFCSP